MDIGVLIKNGTMHSLDNSMKLKLIKHTPDAEFKYPTKFMYDCNRRFKPEWVQSHLWLHYSPYKDGVYCKACVFFAPANVKQQKLGLLVNKLFPFGLKNLVFSLAMDSLHTIKILSLEW